MPENLKTLIQNWRGNTAGGNQLQLLSKLRIGDALYNIKDPAVEELAAQVETRLGAIESKTIRESALTKDASAGKFATSVTQGTDGQVPGRGGVLLQGRQLQLPVQARPAGPQRL